jgi:hypothetical protein
MFNDDITTSTNESGQFGLLGAYLGEKQKIDYKRWKEVRYGQKLRILGGTLIWYEPRKLYGKEMVGSCD